VAATVQNLKLIWGAKKIGEVIGRNTRETFAMLEKGYLPAKKVGRLWVSEEDALRKTLVQPAE
jgi:hypothetical protein